VVGTIGAKVLKVFWFFFSKKNVLALILEAPGGGKMAFNFDIVIFWAWIALVSPGRIF
jgi:hypothetical protein